MTQIGILVGSLRKNSYNMKIAKYIVENYRDKANFEIIDIKDLPLFNEDLESNLPEPVVQAKKQIKDKDGIIIISPEYNHSIPGVLKNTLDWFSRDDFVMKGKPYLLMGATIGSMGTARMQENVRQVLNSTAFQMYCMPNELLFSKIQDHMDDDGNLINERSINKLDKKIASFIDFIGAINGGLK